MKKTLLITEEERKRISILHENAIKRQHLVEEAPPPFQYNAAQMISAGNQNTQYSAYPVNQNDLNTAFINKTNQQYVNPGNTAADSNTTTTKAPATSNNTSKSNSKVQEIQKKLIELGYGEMLGPKKDDGVLGKNTYNAILSALSSSPKLTTNMTPIQSKIESPSATAELKPSALNQPQKTPVNATTGGSGTGQAAAYDAKQSQVTAPQPASSGGSTTPAAGTTVKPAAAVTNTPSVNTNAPVGKEDEVDNEV